MSITVIAKRKALKARCDNCNFIRRCTPEVSKVCFDAYVKGFLRGCKHERNKCKK